MQRFQGPAARLLFSVLCSLLVVSSREAFAEPLAVEGGDYVEACKAWAKYAGVPEKKLLQEPEILVELERLEKGVKAPGVHEIYVACVPGRNRDLVVRRQNTSWHWNGQAPIVDFTEPQYIAWSTPKITRRYAASLVPDRRLISSRVLFEAQIAPNLYFPQLIHKSEGTTFVGSLLFTFQARLRMLQSTSSPIIPPSFMPRLSLQGLFIRPVVKKRESDDFEHRLVWGGQLTLGHHSNGQEGCFNGNERGIDGARCDALNNIPSFPPNEFNGSYSTNYLRGTVMFRNIFGIDYAGDLSASWYATAAFERHLGGNAGGITEQQAFYTGYHHVLVTGGIEYPLSLPGLRSGRVAFDAAADFSPDADIAYAAGLVYVRASLKYRPSNRGFGFFVGGHLGRDSYNILFAQSVKRLLIGLSYDGDVYRGVEDL